MICVVSLSKFLSSSLRAGFDIKNPHRYQVGKKGSLKEEVATHLSGLLNVSLVEIFGKYQLLYIKQMFYLMIHKINKMLL